MYQLLNNSTCIQRTNDDGSLTFIPADPANSDWQTYQAWLAEDNEPLPAE
jgi:hypothetical protein